MPLARILLTLHDLVSRLQSTAFRTSLVVSLLGACGGDLVLPSREELGTIQVVKGDGQTGEVGEMLELPVEVLVTDAAGDPVRDATVVFELTSAGEGADISPSPTTTDKLGRAEAQIRLGDKVGLQSGVVHAVIEGVTGPSASFSAFADPATEPDNRPPDADYNWHCFDRFCQFTDDSRDSDGAVARWEWDFGDGAASDLAQPFHVYSRSGKYTVILRVTDNDGATDETTAHVDVDD